MFIISGLQQFGIHQNMQNKVEHFDHGPGRKWVVINYLRISKWSANYKK